MSIVGMSERFVRDIDAASRMTADAYKLPWGHQRYPGERFGPSDCAGTPRHPHEPRSWACIDGDRGELGALVCTCGNTEALRPVTW